MKTKTKTDLSKAGVMLIVGGISAEAGLFVTDWPFWVVIIVVSLLLNYVDSSNDSSRV